MPEEIERSIQSIKLTIRHIVLTILPSLFFRNAHVTAVKHTGLVSFDHRSEIFVEEIMYDHLGILRVIRQAGLL